MKRDRDYAALPLAIADALGDALGAPPPVARRQRKADRADRGGAPKRKTTTTKPRAGARSKGARP